MEATYKFAPKIPLNKIIQEFGNLLFPDLRKQANRKFPEYCMAALAMIDDNVIGLIVGIPLPKKNKVQIISFAVGNEFRNLGIGSKLMDIFTKKSADLGYEKWALYFREHWKNSPFLQSILAKQSWQNPILQLIMVESEIKNILKLFKKEEDVFPEGYKFLNWKNLPPEEIEALQVQSSDPRVPENQNPFISVKTINSECSKILYHNNVIVGWVISHIISNKTNEYTSFFLFPEHRKYRMGYKMLADVIKTQHRIGKHPLFVIVARKENKLMSSLLLRHAKTTPAKLLKTYYTEKINH